MDLQEKLEMPKDVLEIVSGGITNKDQVDEEQNKYNKRIQDHGEDYLHPQNKCR